MYLFIYYSPTRMSTQWDQEYCLSYLLLCLQCLVPMNIFGMNNEWMNKWMSEPMLCGGCINSIERSKAEGRWMSPAAIVVTGGCDSCTTSPLQLKPILHVWGGWGEWGYYHVLLLPKLPDIPQFTLFPFYSLVWISVSQLQFQRIKTWAYHLHIFWQRQAQCL